VGTLLGGSCRLGEINWLTGHSGKMAAYDLKELGALLLI
jgi:hypothetical protein